MRSLLPFYFFFDCRSIRSIERVVALYERGGCQVLPGRTTKDHLWWPTTIQKLKFPFPSITHHRHLHPALGTFLFHSPALIPIPITFLLHNSRQFRLILINWPTRSAIPGKTSPVIAGRRTDAQAAPFRHRIFSNLHTFCTYIQMKCSRPRLRDRQGVWWTFACLLLFPIDKLSHQRKLLLGIESVEAVNGWFTSWGARIDSVNYKIYMLFTPSSSSFMYT